METLDRATAGKLFDQYRKNRDGIRNKPEMASICLICGSIHIDPKVGNEHKLVCRNCGFAFYRYACPVCGTTIDGRDPKNPGCGECDLRVCTCGACGCTGGVIEKNKEEVLMQQVIKADRYVSFAGIEGDENSRKPLMPF